MILDTWEETVMVKAAVNAYQVSIRSRSYVTVGGKRFGHLSHLGQVCLGILYFFFCDSHQNQ